MEFILNVKHLGKPRRYYVDVWSGETQVAVGRNLHDYGEDATNEMLFAIEHGNLMKVANVTKGYFEIMGKEVEQVNR